MSDVVYCWAYVARQEQISESVDNVFCLKSDVVDSAPIIDQEDEEASAAGTAELLWSDHNYSKTCNKTYDKF